MDKIFVKTPQKTSILGPQKNFQKIQLRHFLMYDFLISCKNSVKK